MSEKIRGTCVLCGALRDLHYFEEAPHMFPRMVRIEFGGRGKIDYAEIFDEFKLEEFKEIVLEKMAEILRQNGYVVRKKFLR